jgi:hypothetical protein
MIKSTNPVILIESFSLVHEPDAFKVNIKLVENEHYTRRLTSRTFGIGIRYRQDVYSCLVFRERLPLNYHIYKPGELSRYCNDQQNGQQILDGTKDLSPDRSWGRHTESQ